MALSLREDLPLFLRDCLELRHQPVGHGRQSGVPGSPLGDIINLPVGVDDGLILELDVLALDVDVHPLRSCDDDRSGGEDTQHGPKPARRTRSRG